MVQVQVQVTPTTRNTTARRNRGGDGGGGGGGTVATTSTTRIPTCENSNIPSSRIPYPYNIIPYPYSAQWWAYRQQLLCYAMLEDRSNGGESFSASNASQSPSSSVKVKEVLDCCCKHLKQLIQRQLFFSLKFWMIGKTTSEMHVAPRILWTAPDDAPDMP